MLFYSLTFLSGGVFFIKKRLQFLPFWASIRTKQAPFNLRKKIMSTATVPVQKKQKSAFASFILIIFCWILIWWVQFFFSVFHSFSSSSIVLTSVIMPITLIIGLRIYIAKKRPSFSSEYDESQIIFSCISYFLTVIILLSDLCFHLVDDNLAWIGLFLIPFYLFLLVVAFFCSLFNRCRWSSFLLLCTIPFIMNILYELYFKLN